MYRLQTYTQLNTCNKIAYLEYFIRLYQLVKHVLSHLSIYKKWILS